MKITTEITDRDKKLLLFLAIFVIVVVFGFLSFALWRRRMPH